MSTSQKIIAGFEEKIASLERENDVWCSEVDVFCEELVVRKRNCSQWSWTQPQASDDGPSLLVFEIET